MELCLDGDTKRVIGKQDERPGEGLHRMRVQPAEQWSIKCTACGLEARCYVIVEQGNVSAMRKDPDCLGRGQKDGTVSGWYLRKWSE